MSGAQTPTSSEAQRNVLFNPLAVPQAQELQNKLAGQQIDLSNANMEQVSRVSAALLNEPDLAKRAELYPRYVGSLQSQGYAMHAPATLPDEGTLQMLVRQGTPSQTQAEWLANIQANKQYSSATGTPATPGTGAGTTATPGASPLAIPARGTGGPGAGASAPTEWLPYFEEASKETGIPVDLLIAQARQESGFNPTRPGTAGEIGLFQIKPSTAAAPAGMAGVDPASITGPDNVRNNILFGARYLKAQMGGGDPNNPAVQAAALHRYNGGGDPNYVANVFRYRPTLAPSDPNAAVTAYTPPSAGTATAAGTPPTAPAGGSGTPGSYQVASRAPTPPPGSTAAPDASWDLPGAPAPDQPPAPATTAAAPPDATTAPPQPAITTAPAGSPVPPQLSPMNANGLTAQQQAQIDAVASTGRMTVQQRMAAEQGFRNQNIQLQQKQFSDWIQVQQLQTSQGQLSVSQQNSALEYWKAAHPDAKVTMTGGEIITQDPRTGQEIAPRIQVTPQRADTAAMAIVSRLGPKVANGTATPEEQAQYAVAVDSYRQPVLRENPVSKETVRVNTRELPAGFPEPPSLGGGGAPGGAGTGTPGGSNVVIPGLSPQQQQIERNKGRYDIAVEDLKHDRGEINAISDAGRAAQQDNLRVKEMQDILQHADTGPGTENAAKFRAWIARWMPGELSRWDGNAANLSNPAAIEMFQKLGFVGAVTQERGSTPRGGYQATKMFQQFNPGAQLLTSSNQGLLAQRLISNQAEADYAQGAQDHYNTQRERLKSPEQDYDPLTSFDAKWQAQRNPQVYAAAIGALGGQDPEMWARGLSKGEIQRVKDVVTRADPSAVIHMPGEGKVVLQPNAKPLPPGFKVQ